MRRKSSDERDIAVRWVRLVDRAVVESELGIKLDDVAGTTKRIAPERDTLFTEPEPEHIPLFEHDD